jgi:hypothetical protein
MDMTHVQPFLDGMDAGRVDRLGDHLSDDVVLFSPMVSEPFVGREAVVNVLGVLHAAVDEFMTTAVIAGDTRAAVMLRIRAGDTEVTGVDDMSVGPDGRITSMSVQWRPLANIVAIQQRLAPLIGIPALELVEKRSA